MNRRDLFVPPEGLALDRAEGNDIIEKNKAEDGRISFCNCTLMLNRNAYQSISALSQEKAVDSSKSETNES